MQNVPTTKPPAGPVGQAKVEPIRAAIIGCGMIARGYYLSLQHYPEVELVGAADLLPYKATEFAEERDLRPYTSPEELLADDSIELVIDLTASTAHADTVRKCLEAGKNVYSEKPLAQCHDDAAQLIVLAREKGLRLASAPSTFIGEAQQTAAKLLREGRLGKVRLIYAELNHGRVESWHPAPQPFYECGLLFDVGPYPLTMLASIFGPIRHVEALERMLLPERRTLDGTTFGIPKPDFVLALLEFESGPVARLTVCGYADSFKKQGEMVEFHGDEASLYVSNSGRFDAAIGLAPFNQAYQPIELLREPENLFPITGMDYARGVVELAAAMREGRPHRASAEMAAHIIDVMACIEEAARRGSPVEVRSVFSLPEPMPWAY
jgi:predicted dehydrogenase